MKTALVWTILILAALCYNHVDARTGVRVYDVVDLERAARVVTSDGTNFICLITPQGYGFTESKKWTGFTCAALDVEPVTWQYCRGTLDKPLLLCVNADTLINGRLQDADPGNEPKTRMETF